MRALQVEAVLALIPDFQRRIVSQTLLQRGTPLLDVLRRGIRVKCGKALDSLTHNRPREVEAVNPRCEVIALLRERKDDGRVMQLVAPGVHVHRGVEDSIGGPKDKAGLVEVMSQPNARGKT